MEQVGIDRGVRLDWLELTANLILAGNAPDPIKKALQEHLAVVFQTSSLEIRGSLSKTITILMRTWLRVPSELRGLRDSGISLISERPKPEHLPIHWGMIGAVYPFWSAVAAQVGRLLRLQRTVAAVQVQRRLRERYGERETVSRRVRYVLRAFVDWNVLNETTQQGIYSQGLLLQILDLKLISWLIEATLFTRPNGTAQIRDLLDGTNLFPFHILPISAESLIASSPRLDVLRHGLNDDLVMLKKIRVT